MIDHLQERLGALSGDDSVIARFRALDHNLWPAMGETRESKEAFVLHNLWPAMGETRESKEAFVLHGREDVTFLHTHYATLMDRHLATKADTLHEYRLYESWAHGATQRYQHGHPARVSPVQVLGSWPSDIGRGDLHRNATQRYIASIHCV